MLCILHQLLKCNDLKVIIRGCGVSVASGMFLLCIQSKDEGTGQEFIESNSTPVPGHHMGK